jgi:eukaryotic translation initiation factor 2C
MPLRREGQMPVLNVGTLDRPVYLPAELCEALPGQPCTAELGLIQRQNMIKFSCRRPPQNYDSIMTEGLNLMGISGGHTKAVGIKPGKEMITVPARILNPPNLLYGGRKTTNPRNGSWNLVNTKFAQCASISKWTVLWVRKRGMKQPDTPIPNIDGFYRKMRDHGLTLPPFDKPHHEVMLGLDDRENRSLLKDKFKDLANKSYPFLVVVLPTTEGKNFDYVKYAGDLKTGILTHCILYDKVLRSNEQYWSNNAMKVNLKMGGCNQLLQPANARFIGAGKSTMVVGLDVTHPSSADPEVFPSVASIVASIDYRMGQWPGEVRAQMRRQEHVVHLKDMMLGRLHLWQKNNSGNLPQNILVYRDGVSEGQYNMVLMEELPKIQAAAKAVYRGPMPNITIVVCGKRHNVRFYPTNAKDQDRTSNPLNGCVVDRGVTRPMYWDFYLQAQAPLQGSARPAHYIVIHDEIFTNSKANPDRKPVDVLQEVTHNICYMMGRATRSISYSTPAFLADKFCDRGRKYLLAIYHDNNQQVHSDKFEGDNLNISRHCSNNMVYI